jgi:hypothetical protein
MRVAGSGITGSFQNMSGNEVDADPSLLQISEPKIRHAHCTEHCKDTQLKCGYHVRGLLDSVPRITTSYLNQLCAKNSEICKTHCKTDWLDREKEEDDDEEDDDDEEEYDRQKTEDDDAEE